VVKRLSHLENKYKDKKVISIGIVSELTGLTPRQIRYYEERKLIFPDRTKGIRKYSFDDIEKLIDIANKREEGVTTREIRMEMNKSIRNKMLKGQLNGHFRTKT